MEHRQDEPQTEASWRHPEWARDRMSRITMTGAEGAAVMVHHTKRPPRHLPRGSSVWRLTMTYFHMGRPHTIIGAEWFHC